MTSRRLLLVVLVVAAVLGGPVVASVAVAQPQPPASYYGSVTIGGSPAQAGITIQAVVDGTVVGEITTEEAGQYGGESTWEEKLTADCAAADVSCQSGETEVRFRLAGSGTTADQTAIWESTAVERIDLTFPAGSGPTDPGSGSSGTPTPTSTPTASPAPSGSDGGDGGGGGGGGGPPSDRSTGEVQITDRTLLTESLVAGGEAVVEVTLANYDPASGDIALELTVDDSVVSSREVSVGASSGRTVRLRTTLNSPGTYELGVNGESAGTLEVSAAATSTPTPAATSTPTPTAAQSTTATPAPTPAATPTATPTATAMPTTTGDLFGTGLGADQVVGIAAGVGMVTVALLTRLL